MIPGMKNDQTRIPVAVALIALAVFLATNVFPTALALWEIYAEK